MDENIDTTSNIQRVTREIVENDNLKEIQSKDLVKTKEFHFLDKLENESENENTWGFSAAGHPIIDLFLVWLSDLFGFKFHPCHCIALDRIILTFIHINITKLNLNNGKEQLFYNFSKIQESLRYTNRIKKSFEKKSKKNRVVHWLNKPMPYNDVVKEITELIQMDLQKYKYIFSTVSAIDLVNKKYHTFHMNYVWFWDLTQVEQFGDGINKKTGNYVFFILDCATRSVISYEIFPKNDVINSEVLADAVIYSIYTENSGIDPIIIHSDSDRKNASYEYLKKVNLANEIFQTSMNKDIYGLTTTPHGNQVIEIFNKNIKNILETKVLAPKGIKPGDLLNASVKTCDKYLCEAIDIYMNKSHANLSLVGIDHKEGIPISPLMARRSHLLFSQIHPFHINKDTILKFKAYEGLQSLDVKNVAKDNEKMCQIMIEVLKNLSHDTDFIHVLLEMIYVVIISSTESWAKKIAANYFDGNLPPIIEGGGRKKLYSTAFITLLTIKQAMTEYSNVFSNDFIEHIIQKIGTKYSYELEQNEKNIINETKKITDNQTEVLLQQSDANHLEILSHMEKLNKTIWENETAWKQQADKLREDLIFYKNLTNEKHAKNIKLKNRQKKPLTPAIGIKQFCNMLDILENKFNNTSHDWMKFNAARNILCVFILFFTGVRVGSLLFVSYSDIKNIFTAGHIKPTHFFVSKKREQKEQQTLLLHERTFQEYVHNRGLIKYFEFIQNILEKYANQNNLSVENLGKLPLCSSFHSLNKAASRAHMTDTINKIVKESAQFTNADINVSICSSHGFRINVATNLIKKFGIWVAQQVLKHSNITTTTIYDRNIIEETQLQTLTLELTNYNTFTTKKNVFNEKRALLIKKLTHGGNLSEEETTMITDTFKERKKAFFENEKFNPGLSVSKEKYEKKLRSNKFKSSLQEKENKKRKNSKKITV